MRDHRVLIFLSEGYPRAMGRLDTCYAPVRRSPSDLASQIHAAPRLACVKPVASVHPEPGSNSSSYSIIGTEKILGFVTTEKDACPGLLCLYPYRILTVRLYLFLVLQSLSM